ncbi:hypothetical protein CONLIGDRAFT_681405 [Coniochaeta ligniaria NRRL 30616]|uniref:Uncharacterized protein n=1 Tax=Coniochaeta ligniaria NRRL 30616 TaxID=1408157 RepID=A0A1J7ILV0_9PEZI|nr:hypothetical protein CONLIGDRAFT_681405 [Coniochaeta ligniaria NRRL 30616]
MEEHQVPLPPGSAPAGSAPAPSPSPITLDPISRPASTAPAPFPTMLEPISRPSSTSTQGSAPQSQQSFQQLPGIASLQTATAASQQLANQQFANYQQPIASKNPFLPPTNYTRTSPASTAGPGGSIVSL